MMKRFLAATVLTAGLVFSPIGGYEQPVQAEICIEITVCADTILGRICGSVEVCFGGG